jgi:hypothetical protein
MPGIVLDNLLHDLKRSEVEKAETKALREEKERELRLKGEGLKNINMILEDHGLARQSTSNLNFTDVGTNDPVPVESIVDKNSPDGKEMFSKFLDQLK